MANRLFTRTAPNGRTQYICNLGCLWEIQDGEEVFIDVFPLLQAYAIAKAKTAKRADNLIRRATKTNRRKYRQQLKRDRAWQQSRRQGPAGQ